MGPSKKLRSKKRKSSRAFRLYGSPLCQVQKNERMAREDPAPARGGGSRTKPVGPGTSQVGVALNMTCLR